MSTDKNDNAFPSIVEITPAHARDEEDRLIAHGSDGLTKREYFAGLALQGLCAWDHNRGRMLCDYTTRAREAVKAADELIKELNK